VSQRHLRRAVEETLISEGIRPRAVEVSIALIDDATMQELNTRYRNKHTPTDVLSFTQTEEMHLPGAPKLLGDIVISVDTAMRQAKTGNRSLDAEAAQLVIHGVLHLLGYDDATPEGYEEMVRKGEVVWQSAQRSIAERTPRRAASV
jgi:probable rRNA maturation factor